MTSLLSGRGRYRVLCAAIACCLAVTLLTLLVRDARPRLVDANGVSVLVDGANDPPESFDLDGTGGELVLLGETCLGVGGNPGRVVAWPRGSEVATGRQAADLTVTAGSEVDRLGDVVLFSPYFENDWSDEYLDVLPEACRGYEITPMVGLGR